MHIFLTLYLDYFCSHFLVPVIVAKIWCFLGENRRFCRGMLFWRGIHQYIIWVGLLFLPSVLFPGLIFGSGNGKVGPTWILSLQKNIFEGFLGWEVSNHTSGTEGAGFYCNNDKYQLLKRNLPGLDPAETQYQYHPGALWVLALHGRRHHRLPQPIFFKKLLLGVDADWFPALTPPPPHPFDWVQTPLRVYFSFFLAQISNFFWHQMPSPVSTFPVFFPPFYPCSSFRLWSNFMATSYEHVWGLIRPCFIIIKTA